jgi:aminocarboxymuconate-semialdehyde decarboxylase
VGADRVVVGTDYPFDMGEDDPALLIDESGLSGDTVVAIRYRNAISLLGSHVDRLPATVLPPRVVG